MHLPTSSGTRGPPAKESFCPHRRRIGAQGPLCDFYGRAPVFFRHFGPFGAPRPVVRKRAAVAWRLDLKGASLCGTLAPLVEKQSDPRC